MVLATQNPVEHHGTYPLPESQLDRFLMKIEVGYPNADAEKEILHRFTNGNYSQTIHPVLTPEDVLSLQEASRKVHINDKIVDYMIHIVHRTRNHPEIELGISPRGTVALFRTSQALALVDGRKFVLPDDVKRAAFPVFGHRLALVRNGSKGKRSTEEVLEGILNETKVPE
jgi:MoxR-like ATPase